MKDTHAHTHTHIYIYTRRRTQTHNNMMDHNSVSEDDRRSPRLVQRAGVCATHTVRTMHWWRCASLCVLCAPPRGRAEEGKRRTRERERRREGEHVLWNLVFILTRKCTSPCESLIFTLIGELSPSGLASFASGLASVISVICICITRKRKVGVQHPRVLNTVQLALWAVSMHGPTLSASPARSSSSNCGS